MSASQGKPGASAYREYERRCAADAAAIEMKRQRVQAEFGGGRFGKVVAHLAVDSRERLSTKVWEQGAFGETVVGRYLDGLSSEGFHVLHDRKIPGSRANIDHLVVTGAGVWVVDTKRYVGKRPERYVEGGMFGSGRVESLKVGGRKRDKLLESMDRQLAGVRNSLEDEIPVRGILCFVDADWPLLGGAFAVQNVEVLWPKRLKREFARHSMLGFDVSVISARLESLYRAA